MDVQEHFCGSVSMQKSYVTEDVVCGYQGGFYNMRRAEIVQRFLAAGLTCANMYVARLPIHSPRDDGCLFYRNMDPFVGILRMLLVLSLPTLTLQVAVEFYFFGDRTEVCNNLIPGQCCVALGPEDYPNSTAFSEYHGNPAITRSYPLATRIKGLQITEIAAVWGVADASMPPRSVRAHCSGVPWKTMTGPGYFVVYAWDDPLALLDDPPEQIVSGVSYIRLPTTVPTNAKTSLWLAAEGMLGLVWAGGRWLAPGVKNVRLAQGGISKRGIRSSLKGTAYARSPLMWRYPDVIVLNGTNYRSTNTSTPFYQTADGQTLDLAP